MEIQKIFSSYDEYGYEDERLYSVLMSEDELRFFADKKERTNLEYLESHKGRKRTAATILLETGGGIGTLAGRIAGNRAAIEADKKGASDDEILLRAKKKGGKVGAITGAAVGAGIGALANIGLNKMLGGKATASSVATGAITRGLVGAGIGYLGGRNSAKAKVEDKINQRLREESRYNR